MVIQCEVDKKKKKWRLLCLFQEMKFWKSIYNCPETKALYISNVGSNTFLWQEATFIQIWKKSNAKFLGSNFYLMTLYWYVMVKNIVFSKNLLNNAPEVTRKIDKWVNKRCTCSIQKKEMKRAPSKLKTGLPTRFEILSNRITCNSGSGYSFA